jgi:putative flippase GtrA
MTGLIQRGRDRGVDRRATAAGGELRRRLRFLLVGGSCFCLQYALLRGLSGAGLARPLGNGLGFAASAQLNFLLSARLTWGDRNAEVPPVGQVSRRVSKLNGYRWLSYNMTAATALVVNTLVFAAADPLAGALLASLAGVAAGTVVTYLVCDRLIFAPEPGPPAHREPVLQESSR